MSSRNTESQMVRMILAGCGSVRARLIEPGKEAGQVAGKIECRERLGGLLKYYYRDAA